MEVDLTYNGSCFGRLSLPAIKTNYGGATVKIDRQKFNITDMPVYLAYVQSTIVNKEATFELQNGACKIRAMGLRAKCEFRQKVPIPGMNGPKITVASTQRSDRDITMEIVVHNPSPVEMNHGTTILELRNEAGEALADMKGDLDISRGDTSIVLTGRLRDGAVLSKQMRLVGKGVEDNSWCNETIKFIDVVVDLSPEMLESAMGGEMFKASEGLEHQ